MPSEKLFYINPLFIFHRYNLILSNSPKALSRIIHKKHKTETIGTLKKLK